ncbi:MAG: hypothetical protein M1835_003453 [Candelina submexicana]|nr:MAG: hypothetical protein M1835_003453 [Candelina submexicana]
MIHQQQLREYERATDEESESHPPASWTPSISNLLNAEDTVQTSGRSAEISLPTPHEPHGDYIGGIVFGTRRAAEPARSPIYTYEVDLSKLPTEISSDPSYRRLTPGSSSGQSSSSLEAKPDNGKSKPEYTMEQQLFLWYYRVDQNNPWEQVAWFYGERFEARSKSGLECRFYRTVEDHYDVPKTRAQPRWAEDHGEEYRSTSFGMIPWLERPENGTPKIAESLKGVGVYDWVQQSDRVRFSHILRSKCLQLSIIVDELLTYLEFEKIEANLASRTPRAANRG